MLQLAVQTQLTVIVPTVICSILEPRLIPAFAAAVAVAVFGARGFIPLMHALRTASNGTRGTAFGVAAELFGAVSTVRAYGQSETFIAKTDEALNRWTQGAPPPLGLADRAVDFIQWSVNSYFSLRTNVAGLVVGATVSSIVVARRTDLSPAHAALILASLVHFCFAVGQISNHAMVLQQKSTSIARLLEYVSLEQEASTKADVDTDWPTKGAIELRNVSFRYRAELPIVLADVSLSIRGGEKIALVGRSGCGKSTLLQALFRFAELADGQVLIDGVDVATLPLKTLRSRIACIPQEVRRRYELSAIWSRVVHITPGLLG